jgi:hypothetical protein
MSLTLWPTCSSPFAQGTTRVWSAPTSPCTLPCKIHTVETCCVRTPRLQTDLARPTQLWVGFESRAGYGEARISLVSSGWLTEENDVCDNHPPSNRTFPSTCKCLHQRVSFHAPFPPVLRGLALQR